MRELLSHYLLSMKRSYFFEDQIIGIVIKSVVALWLLLSICASGAMLPMAIREQIPDVNLQSLFFYLLAGLCCIDLLIKYIKKNSFYQKMHPYLLLPIPKYKLFGIALCAEIVSPWNWWMFVFCLPYLAQVYSIALCLSLLFLVWVLAIFNSLLVRFVKSLLNWITLQLLVCIPFAIAYGSIIHFRLADAIYVFILSYPFVPFTASILLLLGCLYLFRKLSQKELYNSLS